MSKKKCSICGYPLEPTDMTPSGFHHDLPEGRLYSVQKLEFPQCWNNPIPAPAPPAPKGVREVAKAAGFQPVDKEEEDRRFDRATAMSTRTAEGDDSMTNEDMRELKQGDMLIDRDGGRWVVTDFTHAGNHVMPTVVRTMVITFPGPWRKFEPLQKDTILDTVAPQ